MKPYSKIHIAEQNTPTIKNNPEQNQPKTKNTMLEAPPYVIQKTSKS